MTPLYLTGRLRNPSGKPMTWAGIVRHMKIVCGVSVPGPYDRKSKIIARYDNTAFLDKMRKALIEKSQR
jgi:hypothetical protein